MISLSSLSGLAVIRWNITCLPACWGGCGAHRRNDVIKEGKQLGVEAIHVEESDWLGVNAELLPSDHLHYLLQRPIAACTP